MQKLWFGSASLVRKLYGWKVLGLVQSEDV